MMVNLVLYEIEGGRKWNLRQRPQDQISDNAIYFIHTAISVNSVNLEEIVIMTKCFIIKWQKMAERCHPFEFQFSTLEIVSESEFVYEITELFELIINIYAYRQID